MWLIGHRDFLIGYGMFMLCLKSRTCHTVITTGIRFLNSIIIPAKGA